MRVFFATDIHGSETCWRKLLNAGPFYEASVVILGGDMTGKGLVPIVRTGTSSYWLTIQGQRHEVEGDDELKRYQDLVRERGLYHFITTPDELEEYRTDPLLLEAAFLEAVLRTVEEWVEFADARLARTNLKLFVCPGNDDAFEIDALLAAATHIELAEGRCLPLGEGYEMVSTGWSNPTPWNTHREASEEELERRIQEMVDGSSVNPERLVFNFHCPPFGVPPLDEAPAINDQLEVMDGGREVRHVGSVAVKKAIAELQPAVSLHGHIHEGRGAVRLGRTMAVNPGSAYETGVLQGALVELNGNRVKSHWLTSG